MKEKLNSIERRRKQMSLNVRKNNTRSIVEQSFCPVGQNLVSKSIKITHTKTNLDHLAEAPITR